MRSSGDPKDGSWTVTNEGKPCSYYDNMVGKPGMVNRVRLEGLKVGKADTRRQEPLQALQGSSHGTATG